MRGDFDAFYLRHFKAIYRVCYAFMKNAQDAEDCTEDAFVRAMPGSPIAAAISPENVTAQRQRQTVTAMTTAMIFGMCF